MSLRSLIMTGLQFFPDLLHQGLQLVETLRGVCPWELSCGVLKGSTNLLCDGPQVVRRGGGTRAFRVCLRRQWLREFPRGSALASFYCLSCRFWSGPSQLFANFFVNHYHHLSDEFPALATGSFERGEALGLKPMSTGEEGVVGRSYPLERLTPQFRGCPLGLYLWCKRRSASSSVPSLATIDNRVSGNEGPHPRLWMTSPPTPPSMVRWGRVPVPGLQCGRESGP